MIVREEPYGWGVLALPVSRAEAACAVDAVAWRGVLASFVATLLVMGLALIYRQLAPTATALAPAPAPAAPTVVYSLRPERAETPPPPPPAIVATERPQAPAAARKKSIVPPPSPATLPAPARPAPAQTKPDELAAAAPPVPKAPPATRPAAVLPAPAAAEPDIRLAAPAAPARVPRPTASAGLARERMALQRPTDMALPHSGARGQAPRPTEHASLPPGTALRAGPTQPAEIELQPAPTPAPRGRAGASAAPAPERTTVHLGGLPAPTLAKPAPEKLAAPRPAIAAGEQASSFAFLDRLAPAELDRSFLVSLNRLATCRDPGAETALKVRLATLLGRPALCRSGGVIFDVLYPESAYSIHVSFYNYERRDFADRCAVLRQAVECFEARR